MLLRPCPSCRRHVATDVVRCVFCAADLPPAPSRGTDLPGRFSRAAVFAGASLVGCSSPTAPAARPETTAASSPVESAPEDTRFAQPPPVDAGERPAEPPPPPPPPPPVDAGLPPAPDASVAKVAGGALHISLHDSKTGAPVTGIYIYMWPPNGEYRAEVTDATGTARFDGLAKGTYKVRTPTGMLIDGAGEAGADGQKDEQIVVGKTLVKVDRRIPVRRTNAVRAPIPKPYGAPPARRRMV